MFRQIRGFQFYNKTVPEWMNDLGYVGTWTWINAKKSSSF